MNKDKEIFGIAISKDVFDVYSVLEGHCQFRNDATGFKLFLKTLPKAAVVVMEATGYYHYRLAQYLFKQGVFRNLRLHFYIPFFLSFFLFRLSNIFA